MNRKRVEELSVGMDGLLYCLQDSVCAYSFELEDSYPKKLHEVSDRLGSSHSYME